MEYRTLFGGFGGQGIISMGALLAHAGMAHGRHVTFYPAYGIAMRGGTANCSVIVSEEPVASPIIANPNVLVVMNEPSLEFFSSRMEAGGTLMINSTLVQKKSPRTDVTAHYVPANLIAEELGDSRMANSAMLGAVSHATHILPIDVLLTALEKSFAKKNPKAIDLNLKAMRQGYDAVAAQA